MKKNIFYSLYFLIGILIWFWACIVFLWEQENQKNMDKTFVPAIYSLRICNLSHSPIDGFSLLWSKNWPRFWEIWEWECSDYKDTYKLYSNQALSITTWENTIRNRYLYTSLDDMEAPLMKAGRYTLNIIELNEWKITIEHQDAIKYNIQRDWDFKSVFDLEQD